MRKAAWLPCACGSYAKVEDYLRTRDYRLEAVVGFSFRRSRRRLGQLIIEGQKAGTIRPNGGDSRALSRSAKVISPDDIADKDTRSRDQRLFVK